MNEALPNFILSRVITCTRVKQHFDRKRGGGGGGGG